MIRLLLLFSGSLLGIFTLAYVIIGCGQTPILGAQETENLLRQLPYRYEFREVPTPEGAESALAGRAIGRHHTVINFGVALGHGHHGVPVPQAGISEPYSSPRDGFIFTNDLEVKDADGHLAANPHFHTAAQWNEAISMSVMMTDKLCLAITGEHCPAV